MPIWPFLIIFFCALAAFGFISEKQGRFWKIVTPVTLGLATMAAIITGLLLVGSEPWELLHIDPGEAHIRRGGLIILIVNSVLMLGPQLTGAVFLAIGIFFSWVLIRTLRG